MRGQTGWLVLGVVFLVVGVAWAEPPINPLVEGREPNPVAQQFHEAQQAPVGYLVQPVAPARTNPERLDQPVSWIAMMEELVTLMLDRLTIPLGTVPIHTNGGGALGGDRGCIIQ